MHLNPYLRLHLKTNRSSHKVNLSPLHTTYPREEKSISYLPRCLHQKCRHVTLTRHPPASNELPTPNILAKNLSNLFISLHLIIYKIWAPMISSLFPRWSWCLHSWTLHTVTRVINLKCRSGQGTTPLLKTLQWFPKFLK